MLHAAVRVAGVMGAAVQKKEVVEGCWRWMLCRYGVRGRAGNGKAGSKARQKAGKEGRQHRQ